MVSTGLRWARESKMRPSVSVGSGVVVSLSLPIHHVEDRMPKIDRDSSRTDTGFPRSPAPSRPEHGPDRRHGSATAFQQTGHSSRPADSHPMRSAKVAQAGTRQRTDLTLSCEKLKKKISRRVSLCGARGCLCIQGRSGRRGERRQASASVAGASLNAPLGAFGSPPFLWKFFDSGPRDAGAAPLSSRIQPVKRLLEASVARPTIRASACAASQPPPPPPPRAPPAFGLGGQACVRASAASRLPRSDSAIHVRVWPKLAANRMPERGRGRLHQRCPRPFSGS
ncbi:hypothetical protein L1887_47044 [Cichorium endivia]|nr:hypothetical protein L1887_47044 [Cichorium endivia]